ncbi:MAG: hypothetical protein KBS68_01940 [Clostridiales bacterium]|nr:hypothetical protein [Candidatus Crickella merdequi]
MRKKLIAIIVTVILAFGSVSVFADTGNCADNKELDFAKVYKLANEGTVSPAENFTFKIEKVGVTNSSVTKDQMPSFAKDTFTISHGAASAAAGKGTSVSTKIALPEFTRVGEYTYRITEVAGDTAGVQYNAQSVLLKITVTNCAAGTNDLDRTVSMKLEGGDETKVDSVVNTYSAGRLLVTKDVEGIFGDRNENFKMAVTFKAPAGKKVMSDITYSDNGTDKTVDKAALNSADATVTVDIDLKDGETVEFKNIPYGVEYQVKEADYSSMGYATRYDCSDDRDTKTVDSEESTVTVINSKGGTVDTGVLWTVTPYVIALLLAGALTAVVIRRRRMN